MSDAKGERLGGLLVDEDSRFRAHGEFKEGKRLTTTICQMICISLGDPVYPPTDLVLLAKGQTRTAKRKTDHVVKPLRKAIEVIVDDAADQTGTHKELVLHNRAIQELSRNPPNSEEEFTRQHSGAYNTPFLRSSNGRAFRDRIVDACLQRRRKVPVAIRRSTTTHKSSKSTNSTEGPEPLRRSTRSTRAQTHRALQFGTLDNGASDKLINTSCRNCGTRCQ